MGRVACSLGQWGDGHSGRPSLCSFIWTSCYPTSSDRSRFLGAPVLTQPTCPPLATGPWLQSPHSLRLSSSHSRLGEGRPLFFEGKRQESQRLGPVRAGQDGRKKAPQNRLVFR